MVPIVTNQLKARNRNSVPPVLPTSPSQQQVELSVEEVITLHALIRETTCEQLKGAARNIGANPDDAAKNKKSVQHKLESLCGWFKTKLELPLENLLAQHYHPNHIVRMNVETFSWNKPLFASASDNTGGDSPEAVAKLQRAAHDTLQGLKSKPQQLMEMLIEGDGEVIADEVISLYEDSSNPEKIASNAIGKLNKKLATRGLKIVRVSSFQVIKTSE